MVHLSTQTFCDYERHLRNAKDLVLTPQITRIADNKFNAFNLTTERTAGIPRFPKAERVRPDRAPLWLSLPLQTLWLVTCAVLFIGMVVLLPIMGLAFALVEGLDALCSRMRGASC